jgi:hypothetical protein
MTRPGSRWSRRRGDRGAATAELALVLPLLVALTIGLVWLLSAGLAQVRAVDAARETARMAARGDADAAALARGREVAVPGSEVALSRGDGEVRVVVRGTVHGPGGLFGALPGIRVEAVAVAVDEAQAP